MNAEIKWLIALGLKRHLFTAAACKRVAHDLGASAELVTFAEQLLKIDACSDFDAMQNLVEDAFNKSLDEDPPADPYNYVESEDAEAEPVTFGSANSGLPQIPDINSLDSDEAARECLTKILDICHEVNASDLHLSAGARPFIRRSRALDYLSDQPLTATASNRINTALLSEDAKQSFKEDHDMDLALSVGVNRYRVNLMVHKEGVAGSYRIVPAKAPKLDQLGFNHLEVISKLLSYHNGLILLTGPVGSGKTTTLAAMIDELNKTRNDHLIVVEEPIEIIQSSGTCHITQREVGPHTKSFSSALKGALRQDPDIIVIGEMRDLETIEMAISASETGHLVIGTMHTNNAANTLNRVLDVFPAAQQTQIRAMLSSALRGIVCQNLIPGKDGGLELAYEILVSNMAIRNLIEANKPEGIKNAMETGASEGMQLMDKSVFSLWEAGKITDKVALHNLRDRMMRQRIQK